jgi:hypothetical protein
LKSSCSRPAIREKALGPEHPDTIRVRDNLANLRRAEGAA